MHGGLDITHCVGSGRVARGLVYGCLCIQNSYLHVERFFISHPTKAVIEVLSLHKSFGIFLTESSHDMFSFCFSIVSKTEYIELHMLGKMGLQKMWKT